MTFSIIILTALIILIMFGAGQRFLDKMRLTDKWAILILGAIIVGLMIPSIKIGAFFSFSIGGFLIPFGLVVYLFIKTGWSIDLLRGIVGSILTALLIVGLNLILPSETPDAIVLDNTIFYGIIAGTTAYVLGRSRRNAFICAVLGITLSNVGIFVYNLLMNAKSPLNLGSGGTFDTIIIASLIAVGLCELFGKTVESVNMKQTKKAYNFETGEFIETEKKQGEKHGKKKTK